MIKETLWYDKDFLGQLYWLNTGLVFLVSPTVTSPRLSANQNWKSFFEIKIFSWNDVPRTHHYFQLVWECDFLLERDWRSFTLLRIVPTNVMFILF
jgi:hypothetical protein